MIKTLLSLLVLAMLSIKATCQPTFTDNINVNSYSQSYISEQLDILIKDANYYNRLDNIAQADFDNNQRCINQACNYYKSGDYESAIYYAKDIGYTNYVEIKNIKHFVMTTSYSYLNDVPNFTFWYKASKKKVDPVTMRAIDEIVKNNSSFAKSKNEEKRNKHKKHTNHFIALMVGIGLSVGSIYTVFTFR